jgi:Calcineurin-like phosphoesterase
MDRHTYLVFGDLHGRVLPAFALAMAWQREHAERVTALLQVGDLGYFPFLDRLDRATKNHARKDPLELGVQQILRPSAEADSLFALHDLPGPMWFIAGNHDDYQALNDVYGRPGSTEADFPVDHYGQVRCIVNGHVATLPGGLRVGGLWGIDHEAPNARRHIADEMRIAPRVARRLAMQSFDILMSHDSPRDASVLETGSLAVTEILSLARPAFAFYGHYHGVERLAECDYAPSEVRHLCALDFYGRGHTANENAVGVLRWAAGRGSFEYIDPKWLKTITRHNWLARAWAD